MIMISKSSLVLFLFSSVLCDQYKDINLKQGPVRGYKGDGNHYVFYGIPYAKAPMGVDKFKSPLPALTWSTKLEAVNKNIICPQHEMIKILAKNDDFIMTEDCLIANVYVPDTNKKNLPVLVVIHGGAYQIGYGELLKSGEVAEVGEIIIVTFNYRLGIHGFLCLGTEKAPGNAGMKDMVALLKWVQENIADFNGDSKDVTLTGYSAGSSAVEHLILAKSANNLFKKAIADSGNAVSSWGVSLDPIETAINFAMSEGINIQNLHQLETYFTEASIEVLTSKMYFNHPNTTFEIVPCVERDVGQEMFLSDSPMNILKSGNFRKIPLLIGHSKHEGLIRSNLFDDWADRMDESFIDFLPADLQFSSHAEKNEVAKKVKSTYFGDVKVKENTLQYINYFSDAMFKYPNYRSVGMQVKAGSTNVYFYEYQFFDESAIPSFEQLHPRITIRGPGHCAQTYIFYGDRIGQKKHSEDYKKMQTKLRSLWINFIKTGRPTSDKNMEWPAVSSKGAPYMVINQHSELKLTPLLENAKLWDDIYEKYYRHPVPPTFKIKEAGKVEL